MGLNRETLQFICSMEFWRMAVFWTISLIFSYFQLLLNALSPSSPSSYPRRSPDPSTKPICIITGASSGLGASAARCLSREGYYVILAGRSSYLLSKVDLSSFQSILKFRSSVEQWILDNDLHPSVQLLINNAGILATSYRVTAEGYDQMMATNYIGPFALTSLLLPLLKNSPSPSRIVNVTSFVHRCVSNNQVDEERLSGKYLKRGSKVDQYPLAHIYEYSKCKPSSPSSLSKLYFQLSVCVLLFSYELHRRLWLTDPSHQISVLAADPGAVKTSIMREVPPHVAQLAYTSLRYMGLLKSPESGIDSVIDAALAPPEASGLYFFGGKGRILKSSALSYDAKLAEKLWSSSCELLREVQLVL